MKSILQKVNNAIVHIVFIIDLFVVVLIRPVFNWYENKFGVSLVEILYTIKSPMKGADTDFLNDAIRIAEISTLMYMVILMVVFIAIRIDRKLNIWIVFYSKVRIPIIKCLLFFVFAISLVGTIRVSQRIEDTLHICDYAKRRMSETHIYEEQYVTPQIDLIEADNPKNLIYIYMESMETTYASKADGGFQEDNNYIPKLTQMAKDNISFSDSELLGGFKCISNTGWTIAAIFATESGIPFSFPVEGNSDYMDREGMAVGTVCLGDVLEEKGYYQEFLCGSDSIFGGRRAFFEQHGNYAIYDVNTAIKDGYITEDQKVWWGLEDKNLYRIAKDELSRMADLGQPFNLTILTVDTHHVDGWVCDMCGDEYPEQLANVVKCADNQIYDFVNWCKEQDWYDNTVIVIEGDHPRMDTSLVNDVEYLDRTVYNCFINVDADMNSLELKNREFTSFDMYPTVLSALGFSIPDNRLGLGTDLFSESPTLVEKYGLDYISDELGKFSQYFIDTFS